MALKTVTSLLTGVAVAIGLAVLGVDRPIVWGLLAFVLDYVPNVGSIIAAIPGVLLALVQFGVAKAAAAAFGDSLINVAIGSLMEPRLMGRRAGDVLDTPDARSCSPKLS